MAIEPDAATLFTRGRQRAFIKVQDGCRHRCTFCITTLARGPERSRPPAEICAEVAALAAAGVKEVVLTGVHAAGYGGDIGSSLTDLVAALLADTDVPRIRLGSVEPWDLPADLWRLFADPRLMPHLHLPLQSGADGVLRRMARRCKRAGFERLVAEIRAAVPDVNIGTDIIVGFPGETDAEWRATLDAVEQIGFGHLHVFAYSRRAGTAAAAMSDQVPGEVKRARVRELNVLGLRLTRRRLEGAIGRTVPVLLEAPFRDASGAWIGAAGYTPDFLPVRVPEAADPGPAGMLLPVRLERVAADGTALIGRVAAAVA